MSGPLDEATAQARSRLGAALRRTRQAAGLSTRQVPKEEPGTSYTSGHISLVESGSTVPSLELIAAYVSIGGDAAELRSLHQQAEAASMAAGRARRLGGNAPEVLPPQDATTVSGRDEVEAHYVVVAQDVQYRFGPTGAIEDVLCKARVRAKSPRTRLLYAGFTYPAEQRRGVLSVEPTEGVTLADFRESETGAIIAFLCCDRDLHPSDPDAFPVSFRLRIDSERQALPRLRYFADAGTERLVLSATFPAEMEPRDLWWFGARDIVDAEHRQPGRDLAHDGNGGYERTFDDLVPMWCYGFAWTW